VTFAGAALLLALRVAATAAPGCPAALDEAAGLADGALAGEAAALLGRLGSRGAGGPTAALAGEVRRAEAPGAVPAWAGARLRAALVRHCALAAEAPLPAAGPADRARAAEILDRPEFRRARLDPEALRRRLLDLWQHLLALLETGEAQRYAAFSRAAFLGAAAVAALLGLLALGRRRPGRAGTAAPAPAGPPLAPEEVRLAEAEAAARAGQAARAVRLALLAALAALEREGIVPPGRALTNGELVRLVDRAAPARSRALAALARTFDEVVYGGRPAGPPQAAAALEAARAVGAGEAP